MSEHLNTAGPRVQVISANEPVGRVRRRWSTSDDEALTWIKPVVDKRPTYGYRRVTAVVNRLHRADGLGHLNHKRIYRIMKRHNLLLAKHSTLGWKSPEAFEREAA